MKLYFQKKLCEAVIKDVNMTDLDDNTPEKKAEKDAMCPEFAHLISATNAECVVSTR